MIWARYEFLIHGKVEQCGTDLFSLVYCDHRWLIASIAYSSRQSTSRNVDAWRPRGSS
jgi:hypothetical protein